MLLWQFGKKSGVNLKKEGLGKVLDQVQDLNLGSATTLHVGMLTHKYYTLLDESAI